mgnify:CR=1 FL=1
MSYVEADASAVAKIKGYAEKCSGERTFVVSDLEYVDYIMCNYQENFSKVIDRAKLACQNSGQEVLEHFPEVRKMLEIGNNAKRNLLDYELSRYACYLIVQNGDPRKEVIALGQTYFAIQTYRQEVYFALRGRE